MTEYIRFSAAHLFSKIWLYTPSLSIKRHLVVSNPKDPTKLQSLSAGPKFPSEVQDYLVRVFKADPAGFSGNDARCKIPEDKLEGFLSWFVRAQYYVWLSDETPSSGDLPLIDWDPVPELTERLTTPYWEGLPPPLRTMEGVSIPTYLQRLVRQPPPLEGESTGGKGAAVRFFILQTLQVNDLELYQTILEHPAFFLLPEEVLRLTEGGRKTAQWHEKKLLNNTGLGLD